MIAAIGLVSAAINSPQRCSLRAQPRCSLRAQPRCIVRLSESLNHLPPNECPPEGVSFTSRLDGEKGAQTWVLQFNHFVNIDFFNKQVLSGVPESSKPQIGYPVRMAASAGYQREFTFRGGPDRELVGDQTILNLVRPDVDGSDLVAMLMPLSPAAMSHLDEAMTGVLRETVSFEHFTWLAWMDPPADLTEVLILRPGPMAQAARGPPTFELPMVQSYLDDALVGALQFGEDFAGEWLDTTHGWSRYWLNDRLESRRPWVHTPEALRIDRLLRAHPPAESGRNAFERRAHVVEYAALNPALGIAAAIDQSPGRRRAASAASAASAIAEQSPPSEVEEVDKVPTGNAHVAGGEGSGEQSPEPCCARRSARNFIIGFGSIIQTDSRRSSDPGAVDAAPCRVRREFGYVREWNFQSATAQICALGLRRVRPGEAGSSFNGVCFPAPDDLGAFDERENGYQRVEVPMEMVELLSWQALPADAMVYVYVPYAPVVVERYGNDEGTGLPRCSGPTHPDGLDEATEGSGQGLLPPSVEYPILQTYVDVCLSGCLEHGDDFAREFIETTFLWAPFWLNERTLARRPWVHQKQYVKIDRLLAAHVPAYYARRRLESEYATLLTEGDEL